MAQNFLSIPKIGFIHSKDELKIDKEDLSTLECITKKRKLSDICSEGSTNTRKESMNDSFVCIQNNSVTPIKNTSSDFTVNIPKPIRPNCSNKKMKNSGANEINNNFSENQRLVEKLLKMNLSEISRPFTDFLQKQQGVEKSKEEKDTEMKDESKNPNDSKNIDEKKINFPLFYFPFGVPLGKTNFSEFLQQNFEDLKKSSNDTNSVKFIGPLTLEERKQKITRYLEKKKKRKWKYVRYNIRKDLADQRQRFQGRFVKTNKIKFPFIINDYNSMVMSGSYNEDLKTSGSFMEKSNNSL